jgi:selenocysteine lyase/cysteine desulfurase
MDPAAVALELDERFKIMSRSGLHCAPSAHKLLALFQRDQCASVSVISTLKNK